MRFRGIAPCLGFAIALAFGGAASAQPRESAPEGPPSDPSAPADSSAPAAPPDAATSTDPSTDARALGRALLAEGSADQAAQVFLTAYEASHDPSLLLDVADALLADGDGPGAVEALERFVREVPSGTEADAARQRIAEIEQMPSALRVSSVPSGAEVRVDGEAVGVTPLEVEIVPGEHSVEVALEGHVSAAEQVVVPFGSRRPMRFELVPEPTEEPVEASPALPLEPTLEPETSATPAIWATASISAAALLTGTIFGFKALSEESDFVIEPTHAGADRGERYSLVADIAFGIAAASAVTALVLWLTGDDQDDEGMDTARLRITGAPAGAGLGGQIGF
jgi:hypothetical protein